MPQVLHSLKISEVSCVDRPANAETDPLTGKRIPRATVALWKRDAEVPVAKGVKYLVSGKDGDHLPYTGPDGKPDHSLMGAAWAALHTNYRGQPYGGPDKAGAISRLSHIYQQEGIPTPANKGDSSMTLEQIEKKISDQDALLAKLNADNDTLKADNSVLKTEATIAKMGAKEKKAFGQMTDKQKADYMAADTEKRKSMCKEFGKPDDDEAEDGDSDGSAKKIAKAEATFKAQLATRDERITKTEAELTRITKQSRTEHFAKRAEAELPNTPGTPVEKGQTLMQLADSLGGEEGEAFKRVVGTMKAADAALDPKFREVGKWGGAANLPAGKQLDANAVIISKRDKITVEKAYSIAMEESPDLVAQYDREQRQFARNQ